MSSGASPQQLQAFLTKWQLSGANELGHAQLFITKLRALLEVEPPRPGTGDETLNAYVFNKIIPLPGGNERAVLILSDDAS